MKRTLVSLWCGGCLWGLSAGAVSAPSPAEPVGLDAARAAAAAVAVDPLLPGTESHTTWRWRSEDKPAASSPRETVSSDTSDERLVVLIRWVAWALVAVGLVWVAVRAWREWLRWRQRQEANAAPLEPPQWVQHLDIRPESLPADVPAAVRKHWQAGDARAALALLYRASLSQLAHRCAVPLHASDTEGECLQAAWQHAPAAVAQFMQQLTPVWSALSYGHHRPPTPLLETLCATYAQLWPLPVEDSA
jgi:hypothetical protein